MPSTRKSTRSPARTQERPASPARRKAARSRSRSSGRNPKSSAPEIVDVKETKIVKKLPARTSRSSSKSPSRTINKESTVTRRTVTSAVFSSSSLSTSQSDQLMVTPLKKSSLLFSLVEKEKQESQRQREQLKLEMLSHIKTPPSKDEIKTTIKGSNNKIFASLGALLLIIIFPAILFYSNCISFKDKLSFKLPNCRLDSIFAVEAIIAILAWFFFQAFLALLPIGRLVESQTAKSGSRFKYICNGFIALIVSLLVLALAVYLKVPVTKVISSYHKLMTSAFVFSVILSISLYLKSWLVTEHQLSSGGNTGSIIIDFFNGRELNPRIGPLDLKFFCKLRPGLIGWIILNWILIVKAFHESSGFPSNLVVITLLQTLYVADALWFEDTWLSTREIVHDGLGFSALFHGIVWIPFFYSIQSRFIEENSFILPWYCLAFAAIMHFVGFFIYRYSQIQKARFHKNPNDPSVSGLESLPTQNGERLLVSGLWGVCRKPHYLGDIIMALSWSFMTGFGSVVTYLYPMYLVIYLVDQEQRDNETSRRKYGASWDSYSQRVKYRIFPYIY